MEVLAQNRVDFIVVGGSAAAFLGASRITEDADCVVNRERTNLENLASALRELHGRLRVAHMSDEESKALPIYIDATMLETLQTSTWMTDAGPFDVLADLKDFEGQSVAYDELLTRSTLIQGEGFSVHVASVDDIIAAKTFANRDKDREAIPELLDIQERDRGRGLRPNFDVSHVEVSDEHSRGIEM